MEDTFVSLSGMKDQYVQTKKTRTVSLFDLQRKNICRHFKTVPFIYEEVKNEFCAFAYYYKDGKIVNHWPRTKPRVLELFAGAGGMCIGLKAAGFDVRWAVESNPQAAATYQANNTNDSLQVYQEDVNYFLKKSKKGHGAYPSTDEVDHIHASPPCQGFSRGNRNGGAGDESNNHLIFTFIEAIKHFKPQTASFENVPGMMRKDLKHYVQAVIENLLRMKYQVRCNLLTASKYGDPQNRKRVILFASRHDVALPTMPAPTHGPDLLPLATTKSAIYLLENNATSGKGSGTISISNIVIHNHLCSSV